MGKTWRFGDAWRCSGFCVSMPFWFLEKEKERKKKKKKKISSIQIFRLKMIIKIY